MPRALTALILAVALLAAPAAALAQSAGDEQYVDPFRAARTAAEQQEQRPSSRAAARAARGAGRAVRHRRAGAGGDGTAEPAPAAEATQATSPTLPRTGVPVLLLAATGYALLLAGIAIRRKA